MFKLRMFLLMAAALLVSTARPFYSWGGSPDPRTPYRALPQIDNSGEAYEGVGCGPGGPPHQALQSAGTGPLPLIANSVRFAVIGDNGTGGKEQYEVAAQMDKLHQTTGFEFVLMDGDNLYGGKKPADFIRKFETPYAPLLQAGVKFYASLGNHDTANERYYKPFNMDGKRYYTFKYGNAEFFALDSSYMDGAQIDWLTTELKGATAAWKICFFHHPFYSDGKFHGPDLDLRRRLEPIFQQYGVRVVFTGHEHFYERLTPQNGIHYFIEGSSGELRTHNLKQSPSVGRGFDTDRAFMVVEIAGDEMYFETVSRTGEVVDSGKIDRQPGEQPAAASVK